MCHKISIVFVDLTQAGGPCDRYVFPTLPTLISSTGYETEQHELSQIAASIDQPKL